MGFLDSLRQAVRGHSNGRGRGAVGKLSLKVVRSYEQGRFGEATEAARQLLDLQREEVGEDHLDYVTALSNLALLLQRQGDVAGAEPLLRRVVATRKQVLGESHPDYATSLNNLGELLSLRGDLEGAEPLLRRALALRKELLGDSHPDYAISLNSLALLLSTRGDRAGAEALLGQALEIQREMLGEYHPDYAAGLGNLANVLGERGELMRAEALLRQSLDIRRAVLGEHHPDCLATLSHLARLLQRRAERARTAVPPAPSRLVGEAPAAPRPAGAVDVPEPASAAVPWDAGRCVEELTELTALFRTVGGQLRAAGRRMQMSGQFPDTSVFRSLAVCHSRLATLSTAVRRLDVAGGNSHPPGALGDDLQELGNQLAVVTRAEAERARMQAMAILEGVLGLHARDAEDRPVLEPCQARARELHAILSTSPASDTPPVVEQLSRGEHPFTCLIALVDEPDAGDDARRAELRRSVAWAFGPPLAECAARAGLFRPSGPATLPAADPSARVEG